MFCVPGLVSGDTEGVGSRFHVFRSRTHFQRCQVCRVLFFSFAHPTHFRRNRGRRVPFSCFARPDSFSAVPRATGPVFMFCATGLVLAVERASGPIFMFCATGVVSRGTEGVEYRFLFLRSRTRFPRYRGRGVLFSCFARPDSISAVPRASGPVFMFYAPEHIFDGTEGMGSHFYVLRSPTHFLRYRGR
jgi:hypothetical protein